LRHRAPHPPAAASSLDTHGVSITSRFWMWLQGRAPSPAAASSGAYSPAGSAASPGTPQTREARQFQHDVSACPADAPLSAEQPAFRTVTMHAHREIVRSPPMATGQNSAEIQLKILGGEGRGVPWWQRRRAGRACALRRAAVCCLRRPGMAGASISAGPPSQCQPGESASQPPLN
jgi:hypothetical protein